MNDVTALGWLILDAMARKGADVGGRYTYRHLERDARVNYAHIQRMVHGGRNPGRETVEAVANALLPYLTPEVALAAAGYQPVVPGTAETARALADAAHRVLTLLSPIEQVPDDEAECKGGSEPQG